MLVCLDWVSVCTRSPIVLGTIVRSRHRCQARELSLITKITNWTDLVICDTVLLECRAKRYTRYNSTSLIWCFAPFVDQPCSEMMPGSCRSWRWMAWRETWFIKMAITAVRGWRSAIQRQSSVHGWYSTLFKVNGNGVKERGKTTTRDQKLERVCNARATSTPHWFL